MRLGKPIADNQATVILRRGRRRRGHLHVFIPAGLALLALALAGWWLTTPRHVPPVRPATPVQMASEVQIDAHTATQTTVFRFAANPRILVIDYASLREQGLTLNRIAAFVEKAGLPRDRVLDTAALEVAIARSGETVESYYYGHDYSAHDVMQFFALADREGIRLEGDEERLRALLYQETAPDSASPWAVISLVQTSPDGVDPLTRRVTLRHELSHGEFFTNPVYADFVRRFWVQVLSPAQRDAFRHFLGRLDYDTANEELMLNEMQAFLMFTPDERYFTPGWIGAGPAEVVELRRRFLATMPAGWLRDMAGTPLPRRRRQRTVITRMASAERAAGERSRRAARRASRYAAAGSDSGRGCKNSRSRAAMATTRSVPGSVAMPL